jgi:hypothetical protein
MRHNRHRGRYRRSRVICPADIAVDADPAVCEALVSVPQPAVADNCAVDFFTNDYTGTDDASAVYPVGTTTVTWTVTDIHGNTASCQMQVVVSDTEDPTVTCPSDIAVSADPGVCEAAVTVPQPVVADNCAVDFFTNDYTGTDDASAVYPVGTTTVTWTVTDIHGNTASCQMDIVVSDVEDPAITCPADIAVDADPGLCEAAVTVPQPAVADNCAVDFFTNDYTGTDNASAVYPVGTTTVTWTVTDIHGNTASCQMQVVVSDTEDPAVTCPADINVSADANCQFTLADYTALASATDNCDPAVVLSQSPAPGSVVSGTTTVTITATDLYGNAASCSFDLIVEDTTDPVINTCAPDVTELTDANCQFALPDYTTLVVADDNCDVSLTFAQTPAPGTIIAGHATTQLVTITVTDDNGNDTQCSFTVTLDDQINPTVSCPADISVSTDAGICSATVAVPLPIAADNCSVVSVINDFNSAEDASGTYPVGTTTVTWIVTDIAGNTATCATTVTVADTEDPGVICPADIAVDADPAVCEALVSVPQPAVADNCAVDFFTNDYTGTDDASAVYPVGTTTVTWTVTDIHGNTASCQMQVVVSDTEDPTVTCPSDINVSADPQYVKHWSPCRSLS